MKTDPAAMSLLYDYYGELLTEKQRSCFDLYYNQDFSLAEIAESEGVSRQGVHDSILRAEASLRECEEKLGCAARAAALDQRLSEIADAAGQILARTGDASVRALADGIVRIVDSIKE